MHKSKILLVFEAVIIAGLAFLIWRYHDPGTQALLVSLIGVGSGAFLGAFFGHLYARRRDQEKAERLRKERRHSLMQMVLKMLLLDYATVKFLAECGDMGPLWDEENLNLTTLDSVALLWHELLHDLGGTKGQGSELSLDFECLRINMRELQSVMDARRQISIRLALGDTALDMDQALCSRQQYGVVIKARAQHVMKSMDILIKLISVEESRG